MGRSLKKVSVEATAAGQEEAAGAAGAGAGGGGSARVSREPFALETSLTLPPL